MKIQKVFFINIFLILSALNIIACGVCVNWNSIEGYWDIVYTNNVNTQFTLESKVETTQFEADILSKQSLFDSLIQAAKQGGIHFLEQRQNLTSSAKQIIRTILPFDQVQISGIAVTQKTTIAQSWQNDKKEIMNLFQWIIKAEYQDTNSSIQRLQAMGSASLILPQGIYPKCSVESCSDKTCQICKVPDFLKRDCKFTLDTGNKEYTFVTSNYSCQNSQLIQECQQGSISKGCECKQINLEECPKDFIYQIDKNVTDSADKLYCAKNPISSQNNTCFISNECRDYSMNSTIKYSDKCLFDNIKCREVVNQKIGCQTKKDNKYPYVINLKEETIICCKKNILLGTQCNVRVFEKILENNFIKIIMVISLFLL
ncbi:hypothetical protein ABPG72_012759 [Tetrahymena utriculariae]